MAAAQAARLPALQPQSFPIVPRALILGGGVAGLSAALSLADQGFHCYLIEGQPRLGGMAQQLHFTLAGQYAQEFLSRLTAQVFGHPNITVSTRGRLVRFAGHCGQFRSTVRQQTNAGFRDLHLEHGVTVVATGAQRFRPEKRYLYGDDSRVLTQWELEARLQADTLTVKPAPRIIMIQCVGSREPEHPYCSRICCFEALKNAILVKNRWPLADVTILYRDIRSYGFQEEYYLAAKEKGVRFLPFEAANPPRVRAPRNQPLLVTMADELLGREIQLPADFLVLSNGIEPNPNSGPLAQLLGLQRTAEGFFLEAHQKLRPVEAASEGIFLCGLAHSPRNLPETISQAQAAAAAAARVLYQQTILSGDFTARIRAEDCRRCLSCLEICPVGAVSLGEDGKPVVHPETCRGCGTCAAQCPARAIAMNRVTESELSAQIQGLFSS
jgi:heterodisulfide reductase subunit A